MIDCLLPGKVRRLGRQMTYLTPRRPVKTTQVDCAIRGGEYTAFDRANYATALRVWLEPAKKGDPEAQTYVGEIFEKGLGLQPDYEAAASWYRRAAEQGYAPAQINLGQLYELGHGVPRDPAQALVWYRRASGLAELRLDFLPSAPSLTEWNQLREDVRRRDREIERLRQQLQTLSDTQRDEGADAARLEAELERLRTESEQLRIELAQHEQAAQSDVPVPAPTIQLLDPKVPRTRGVKVVQALVADELRAVVGHVDAPAGLMSLTLNDASLDVNERGIFRREVVVAPGGTRVRIVATDKRGSASEREFMLTPSAKRSASASVDAGRPRIDFGNYHALVIGNDGYRHVRSLETARNDARVLSELLEDKYGFRVTTLYDATRYEILSALNELRENLTEKDNFLIYYAGHGELDRANSRGHWLPVDAEPDSTANWISNVALTDILNAMSARHVMVVADSCYSGSLTRSSLARLEAGMTEEARSAWMRRMVTKRSRTALTSGGLAPVLDSGGGRHSIFAKALLDVLRDASETLEGQRLFQEISARVAWAAEARNFEQLPQYAPIKYAGHESGDFFLVPRS